MVSPSLNNEGNWRTESKMSQYSQEDKQKHLLSVTIVEITKYLAGHVTDLHTRSRGGRSTGLRGSAAGWRVRRETARETVRICVTVNSDRGRGQDKPQQGDDRQKSEDGVLHC
jgi:hypothetical protein